MIIMYSITQPIYSDWKNEFVKIYNFNFTNNCTELEQSEVNYDE